MNTKNLSLTVALSLQLLMSCSLYAINLEEESTIVKLTITHTDKHSILVNKEEDPKLYTNTSYTMSNTGQKSPGCYDTRRTRFLKRSSEENALIAVEDDNSKSFLTLRFMSHPQHPGYYHLMDDKTKDVLTVGKKALRFHKQSDAAKYTQLFRLVISPDYANCYIIQSMGGKVLNVVDAFKQQSKQKVEVRDNDGKWITHRVFQIQPA